MAGEKKGNIFKRIGRFFKDVKAELKKVTWPTKKQAAPPMFPKPKHSPAAD